MYVFLSGCLAQLDRHGETDIHRTREKATERERLPGKYREGPRTRQTVSQGERHTQVAESQERQTSRQTDPDSHTQTHKDSESKRHAHRGRLTHTENDTHRVAGRGGDRQTIIQSNDSFLSASNKARPKPGFCSSLQVFHMGGKGPISWAIFYCLSGCTMRRLNWNSDLAWLLPTRHLYLLPHHSAHPTV